MPTADDGLSYLLAAQAADARDLAALLDRRGTLDLCGP